MMNPFVGLNVLDFGQGIAGPYGAMLLADFGASVTKIEPPRGDWCRQLGSQRNADQGTTFITANRNKRSLCLDLHTERGREIAQKMALDCDVVVENFRPGVMEKLGLDYASLSKQNENLIYCSVSGYGADGPNVDRPGGDSLIQACGGLMSIVGGESDPPMRVGNPVTDMLAGMHVFEGILVALFRRATSGQGAQIKINLLDTLIAFQAPTLSEYLITGRPFQRVGNDHPLLSPTGSVETADRPVVICVFDHQWKTFCNAIGVPALIQDGRFASNDLRLRNRKPLMEIVKATFKRLSSGQVLEMLDRADLPCAIVNDYVALVSDPQVVHNGTILFREDGDGEPLPFIKNPIDIDGVKIDYKTPPRLGQDSEIVLHEKLGITSEQYRELERDQIVKSSNKVI